MGCDRCGESASGAVRTAAGDPVARQFYEAAAVVKQVDRFGVAAFAMSSFDYYRSRAPRDASAGGFADCGVGVDSNRGERLGLRDVRGDDAGKRNQQVADGAFAGGIEQTRSAARDDHWIDDWRG